MGWPTLAVCPDPIIFVLVKGSNGDASVLGDEPDELLANVFHVVVLLEEADMILNGCLGCLPVSE